LELHEVTAGTHPFHGENRRPKEEEVIKSSLPQPHPFMGGAFTGSQTVYYHRRRSEVVQAKKWFLTHRIRRDAK